MISPLTRDLASRGARKRPFDPTAWYVAEVKRQSEIRCHQFLSRLTGLDYQVESYVASQDELVVYANRTRRIKHNIVIPGKIFIRVDEKNRQDVLKQCMLLVRYLKDRATVTENNFTDFMRVPDLELSRLRQLLESVESPVEYREMVPKTNDKVQVLGGPFHGLKGIVSQDGSHSYATVVLDSLGCFRFRLSTKDLGLIENK